MFIFIPRSGSFFRLQIRIQKVSEYGSTMYPDLNRWFYLPLINYTNLKIL